MWHISCECRNERRGIENMRNQVIISGNLGAVPEFVRKESDGGAVVRFSIAITESKLDQATQKYVPVHTNWIPIKAFGRLAQRSGENLEKGDLVTVFGNIRTSTFEDAGKKRAGFEILANEILLSENLPRTSEEALQKINTKLNKLET